MIDLSALGPSGRPWTTVRPRDATFIDHLLSGRFARAPDGGKGPRYGQIRRSASSVPLNYLEGCGRSSAADRRRFFTIAVGSAHEVDGTLDVMNRFDVLASGERDAGHDLCDHLIAMLRRFR